MERRGNGHYYYEKERDGEKVRSVYAGKGETALLRHQLGIWKKREEEAEKEAKSRQKRLETQGEAELDSLVETVCETARLLTDGLMLVNGYHQHKRQWRKKRTAKIKID